VESPLGTVARFCEAWSRLDLDEIVGFLSDDAVYQNPPPDPALPPFAASACGRSMVLGSIP
jgi:hypothetical protein